MERIDFRTSHNIVLSYPLATLGHRIAAFVIDFIIVWIVFGLFTLVFGNSENLILLYSILFFMFYHLTCEMTMMGQSLGKKLLKIRVVSLNGGTPTTRQYIIRWSFRMLDIMFTLGSLALSSILSSNKNQRLGDVMAGTSVVNVEAFLPNLIKETNKLNDLDVSKLNPLLTQFTDEEMIMVKTMLTRLKTNRTQKNYDVTCALADKISKAIKVEYSEYEVESFLEKTLNDYILITR